MKQKHVGVILIIIALVMLGILIYQKQKEDALIEEIVAEKGSCFLDDGTCLHADRDTLSFTFSVALSISILFFGIYLAVIDKTQEAIAESNLKISEALRRARKTANEADKFSAFVSGFGEDEQKVIKAVHAQEGILQSTLRFRTGISKTRLSLIVRDLEERGVLKRAPEKKTYKVFLVRRF